MWLHRFDVMLLYIMSACNNIIYKYYRICFGECMQQSLWRFVGKLCNRSLDVHEPKWTSHVKRPGDVAQWCTSSGARFTSWIMTCHPWFVRSEASYGGPAAAGLARLYHLHVHPTHGPHERWWEGALSPHQHHQRHQESRQGKSLLTRVISVTALASHICHVSQLIVMLHNSLTLSYLTAHSSLALSHLTAHSSLALSHLTAHS